MFVLCRGSCRLLLVARGEGMGTPRNRHTSRPDEMIVALRNLQRGCGGASAKRVHVAQGSRFFDCRTARQPHLSPTFQRDCEIHYLYPWESVGYHSRMVVQACLSRHGPPADRHKCVHPLQKFGRRRSNGTISSSRKRPTGRLLL